ncbi:MAG: hypothetical protein IKX33_07280 [Prevotella sp.]|nr:hypothetical protein [Prevotella sp.]
MPTYHSSTELTINVRVKGVKHHLVFTPTTLGESFLTVNDTLLERAIEHHPYYGKMFQRMPEKESAPQQTPSDKTKKGDGLTHILFTDFDDAKERLVELTGISRTVLRTPDDIHKYSFDHGIVFDGMPP